MARKYRRRDDKDAWHFCTNCHLWPTTDYEEHDGKPDTNELCNHCRSKNEENNCTPKY